MWYERNVMYSICKLLKVVKSHCDLSVLAVSLMSFQKKKLDRGVSGWVELYPIFLDFWNFFNFAKPLSVPSFVPLLPQHMITGTFNFFWVECNRIRQHLANFRVCFRFLDNDEH